MIKYVLFVGLNDKETKAQEISTIDAYKILSNFACKFVGYGTLTEARGVYTHDNGEIVEEVTIKCEFCGAELDAVKEFAEAAKAALNQESLGFETIENSFDFI